MARDIDGRTQPELALVTRLKIFSLSADFDAMAAATFRVPPSGGECVFTKQLVHSAPPVVHLNNSSVPRVKSVCALWVLRQYFIRAHRKLSQFPANFQSRSLRGASSIVSTPPIPRHYTSAVVSSTPSALSLCSVLSQNSVSTQAALRWSVVSTQ